MLRTAKPRGGDPSAKRRLPPPTTTGKTIRWYSSIIPASWRAAASCALPLTFSSPSPSAFSRAIAGSGSALSITVVSPQSGS